MSASMAAQTIGMANSVSLYGITWEFDGDYQIGRFANGDYWVVGPVTITRITPDFNGYHNGWEVNPITRGGGGEDQGFDVGDGDSFDPNLVPALPYTAQANQSIVKVISIVQNPSNRGDCFPACHQTAAVLTVLASVPPDGGATVFRPPYAGSAKPLYSINDLRTELLPSLAPVADTPTLQYIEDRFQRVQLDHINSYAGRIGRPVDNFHQTDPYGPHLCPDIGDGALRLMLNDPLSAKMPALIYYVQYGIDLYSFVQNGQNWRAGGGHNPGKKLPLTFAATLLDDPGMMSLVQNTDFWSEDEGVHWGQNAGRPLFGFKTGVVMGTTWDERTYWEALVTLPYDLSWADPYGYIDGGRAVDGYQYCCLSMPWKSMILALQLMPQMKPVWGDTLILDYVDRWVEFGAWTQPDPCAPHDGNWSNYGVTYGPDGNGDCIRDTNPSDGIGRFPNKHGENADEGFNSSDFARAMWNEYRQLNGGGIFIATGSLPSGTEGLPYQFQLEAANGNPPYSWQITSGNLPAGVSFSSSGQFSGTPTEAGTFGLDITVTDSDNASTTRYMLLSIAPDVPQGQGLVSYWSFDEQGGNVAINGAGSNNGTLHNGPQWRPNGGRENGALEFDGVDDYVDIGTMDISGGPGMTIALWMRADDFGVADARLISKATGVLDDEHNWMISTYDGGSALRFRLKVDGSTRTLISNTGVLSLNTWHHVAVTYDGSQMRIFRDGTQVANQSASGAIDVSPSVPAAIGNQPAGAGNEPFDGLLDEVRIYNRALSAAEITALFNGTTGVEPREGNLINQFDLEQNFPNPFNPTTKIAFSLPQRLEVKLTVYNVLGQQVAILLSENLPAGRHEIDWQAGDLESGIYYYTLRANGYQETRQMILLK
ncbi:MAG TPA: putative Ig domain-containing protein, partial [Calditrichia bacterium]|nr:putative Ig domain-containing protein [Calditrichia bacterium]